MSTFLFKGYQERKEKEIKKQELQDFLKKISIETYLKRKNYFGSLVAYLKGGRSWFYVYFG